MSKGKKLSITMACALAEIGEHGGEIVCWVGGYWTYQGCPPARGAGTVPEWHVGGDTVKALATRGYLTVMERSKTAQLPIRMKINQEALS